MKFLHETTQWDILYESFPCILKSFAMYSNFIHRNSFDSEVMNITYEVAYIN